MPLGVIFVYVSTPPSLAIISSYNNSPKVDFKKDNSWLDIPTAILILFDVCVNSPLCSLTPNLILDQLKFL